MPLDWNEWKESINQAGAATQEWGSSAYDQGSDLIKRTGLQDVSLGDLWNVPFDFAAQLGTNPSAARYRECKEKNGQSGWDERGVWQCLFPKATRPPVWFSNYTDFLEARDVKFRERQKELTKYEKPTFISSEEAAGKNVTGQEVSIRTVTDDKGNPVTRRCVTTFYDDGTASKEDSSKGGWFWN